MSWKDIKFVKNLNNISEDELKFMWSEMMLNIFKRIEEGDIKIEWNKYVVESFVRPFFGDSDEMYDWLYDELDKRKLLGDKE